MSIKQKRFHLGPTISTEEPLELLPSIQKMWDGAVASAFQADRLAREETTTDRARLLSACADHSGDWLNVPPMTAVGLRLNDEMIRISVGTRLGARTCEPHTCLCGKTVDTRGLHGLSRRKGAARHQTFQSERHNLKSGQKSSDTCCKGTGGPISIGRQTTWWSHTNSLGKWESSHLRRYCTGHICTVTCRRHCNLGSSSGQSCCHKKDVQVSTSDRHQHFCASCYRNWRRIGYIQAIKFIEELGKRITAVTNEPVETQYNHCHTTG